MYGSSVEIELLGSYVVGAENSKISTGCAHVSPKLEAWQPQIVIDNKFLPAEFLSAFLIWSCGPLASASTLERRQAVDPSRLPR